MDATLNDSLGIAEVPMAEPAYRPKFPETQDGRAWPGQGKWTYEDYLRLPDDGQRYEVIRGVLYGSPPPLIGHQFTVMELGRGLAGFVSEHGLGIILPAPVDIKLPHGIATPVQPDLVFIPKKHPLRSRDRFFEGVPALVVEVISPSTRRVDERVKLEAYWDSGVLEYWLVDPRARTVVILGLEPDGKSYRELQRAGMGETARSAVLPGFEVSADEIFLPE